MGPGERPRVALLSERDPLDGRAWSGTVSSMARTIDEHIGEVVAVGPLPTWPRHVDRAASLLGRLAGRGRGLPGVTRRTAWVHGRVASRRLRRLGPAPDLVVAPAAAASLATLRTDLPVVYLSDATMRLLLGYYPWASGLARGVARDADRLEARAIRRADLAVYPTRWAADSAVQDYGADPDGVAVVPYGPNLPDWMVAAPPVDRRPDDGSLRLLLVGVEWVTKGIDQAVAAVDRLRADGIDARLTVVGTTATGPVPGHVRVVPFVDKSTPEGLAAFAGLYATHHLLLLPSRAEAFGIVLAEAAAFGLPAVGRATGGIPEVLDHGSTGVLFTGGPDALATAVGEVWADPERLADLGRAARRRFEETLNWHAWGRGVQGHVRRLLQR